MRGSVREQLVRMGQGIVDVQRSLLRGLVQTHVRILRFAAGLVGSAIDAAAATTARGLECQLRVLVGVRRRGRCLPWLLRTCRRMLPHRLGSRERSLRLRGSRGLHRQPLLCRCYLSVAFAALTAAAAVVATAARCSLAADAAAAAVGTPASGTPALAPHGPVSARRAERERTVLGPVRQRGRPLSWLLRRGRRVLPQGLQRRERLWLLGRCRMQLLPVLRRCCLSITHAAAAAAATTIAAAVAAAALFAAAVDAAAAAALHATFAACTASTGRVECQQ